MTFIDYISKHTKREMHILTCLITGVCIGAWEDTKAHYNWLKNQGKI
jgi:hypothetical protein